MRDVAHRHPHYKLRIDQWERQRDCVEGEDAVKRKGDLYLPRLGGQPHPEVTQVGADQEKILTPYEQYLRRASFMNMTGRTRDALSGAILRKEPDLSWPDSTTLPLLDHAGKCLESIDELWSQMIDETIGVGRYGELVDAPIVEEGQDESNIEPFVATYFAESITDWDEAMIQGRKLPVMVTLLEHIHERGPHGQETTKDRYRVLMLGMPMPETDDEEKILDEQGPEAWLGLWGLVPSNFDEGPVYFQEVWDEVPRPEEEQQQRQSTSQGLNTGKRFQRTTIVVPRRRGGVLWREIPWTFYNSTTLRPKPEKPLMMDVTVINLGHYRNSADHEHGLHFTALPQPWAAGFRFKSQVFVGSGAAWVTDQPNARAGYMEFSGQGLGAIRETMNRKEVQAASLGARIIEERPDPGGTESRGTIELRQAGEKSVLAKVSKNLSTGATRTLRFMGMFLGLPDQAIQRISVKLNTDFGLQGLSPAMLTALMNALIKGTMSWETYFWNLRRGEMTPDALTAEIEAVRIAQGRPQLPGAGVGSTEETQDDSDAGNGEGEEGEAEGSEVQDSGV